MITKTTDRIGTTYKIGDLSIMFSKYFRNVFKIAWPDDVVSGYSINFWGRVVLYWGVIRKPVLCHARNFGRYGHLHFRKLINGDLQITTDAEGMAWIKRYRKGDPNTFEYMDWVWIEEDLLEPAFDYGPISGMAKFQADFRGVPKDSSLNLCYTDRDDNIQLVWWWPGGTQSWAEILMLEGSVVFHGLGPIDEPRCEKCKGTGEWPCPVCVDEGTPELCDDPSCWGGMVGCDNCQGTGEVSTKSAI